MKKEVDKALADQKVSGRRMVIEEVEGSEDEEPPSAPGQGLSNNVESSDDHAHEVVNNTDDSHRHEVLIDKTKDHHRLHDSEMCHNDQGAGDAGTAGTEAVTQTQSVTDKGDTASPDDNLPPAVLALKDAGNELFRKGQYGDAVDKYNAAVQLLGQFLVSVSSSRQNFVCTYYTNQMWVIN